MKKLIFIIILLPVYCSAQNDLLGKSRGDIRAQFKTANVSLVDSNSLYGSNYSDSFKNNNENLICGFDKHKICTRVLKFIKISMLNSTEANLNTNYDKKDGETFSSDVWADKAKTFKIHIEIEKIAGMIYLDYIPYKTPYIIY